MISHRSIALLASIPFVTAQMRVPHGPSRSANPIQHIVVIFQENVSFDHYFATYPAAANPMGENTFVAKPDTPAVNGLSGPLLTNNPNLNPANGGAASNPFRLDRSQAATSDLSHDYVSEQIAADGGLMDLFPSATGPGSMGYYDGNTVTALWHYAQHFAMSDNFYGTVFGPSTLGALNLVSGQTNGVISNGGADNLVDGGDNTLTVIGDDDPAGDACSSTSTQLQLSGPNIGDLLNRAGVTWGFFAGGFDLTAVNPDGSTGCTRTSTSPITGVAGRDYQPHHEPFQYYASTANPTHVRPLSPETIGHDDPANHQYDVNDFFAAVSSGNFPAVSIIKAQSFQDGHPGYSSPLDEQQFIVRLVNFIQNSGFWRHTAIIIAYDDSGGWYDHQAPPLMNPSSITADSLYGTGSCGNGSMALPGLGTAHAQGRCGFGPRLPLLVISPWAKQNYIDHTLTDQTSITRLIEDQFLAGQRIGQGSFDQIANSLGGLFDFSINKGPVTLFLDDTNGSIMDPTLVVQVLPEKTALPPRDARRVGTWHFCSAMQNELLGCLNTRLRVLGTRQAMFPFSIS